jgi:UDP-3-O-[3-hydroxymyristoyl] glucosamine N-acyltransferase
VQWTEVGATIQPIAPYFEHLESTINFNSDIKLWQALKDSIAGAVWLDAPKYHALVAKWCLTGKSPHAR